MIDGLNWFSGRALNTEYAASRGDAASALKEQAESRISDILGRQAPPADTPPPAAAFRELLRGRDAYASVASGGQNIAPYRSAKLISMPSSVDDAPLVTSLVSDADFYLGGGLERMLRSSSEESVRDAELAHIQPHTDPALRRSRRKYLAVVRRLVSSGLFRLIPADQAKEYVGIFFVTKKGKAKVRLVIDARRSNCHFADPTSIELCTGSMFGQLGELENEDTLHIGHADIKDAF